MRPESWLEIPRDLSYALLTWPKGAQLPKPQERQAIEAVAASTLGMHGAKPTWQFTGPHLKLASSRRSRRRGGCSWTALSGGVRTSPDLPGDAILQAMRDAGATTWCSGSARTGRSSRSA